MKNPRSFESNRNYEKIFENFVLSLYPVFNS
jgi:hypothetical protein